MAHSKKEVVKDAVKKSIEDESKKEDEMEDESEEDEAEDESEDKKDGKGGPFARVGKGIKKALSVAPAGKALKAISRMPKLPQNGAPAAVGSMARPYPFASKNPVARLPKVGSMKSAPLKKQILKKQIKASRKLGLPKSQPTGLPKSLPAKKVY